MKTTDSKISSHLKELRKSIGLPEQQIEDSQPAPEPTDAAKKYFKKLGEEIKFENKPFEFYIDLLTKNGYVIDEENKIIVEKLCLYFSGDKRMEDHGINPNKGIALLGGLGVGKTMLMKILRYNSHLPYGFINCSQIADECEQGGSEGIARYFKKAITSSSHLYFGKKEIGFCFNELGREQMPVKYFGNPTNVMERIFFTRYENEVPHNFTHFTSNKSVTQLGELYGDYIRDRFKEMFNLITFPSTAQSRRK